MAVASSGRPARADGTVGGTRPVALNVVSQNLANALTLTRLACTLPIVLLIAADRPQAAFWLFIAAALSDVVDGFVAKRFSGCSRFGAVLDPAADKVLVASLFTILALIGAAPFWFLGLILLKDVLIISGAMILRLRVRGFRVEPLVIGKFSTFMQLLFAGFLLGHRADIADVGWLLTPLLLAASAVTLASGLAYLAAAMRLSSAPAELR
jgi:cardiolipin synthase